MILLLALAPAFVFVVVLGLASATGGGGFNALAAFPIFAIPISIPGLLPLAAARTPRLRMAVAVAMCVVAGGVAVLMATTDQAEFAILNFPPIAVAVAVVVRAGSTVLERRARAPDVTVELVPASVGDRLTALAIDVALFAAAFTAPLTYLSHRHYEPLAAGLGLALGASYIGLAIAWRQRTIGQRVMDMAVIDEVTLGPTSFPRALGRGLVLSIEVTGSALVLLVPLAIAELSAVAWWGGRSITDRVFGTLVVARRPDETMSSRRDAVEGL